MSRNVGGILLLACAALALDVAVAGAQTSAKGRMMTLKGLPGVTVAIARQAEDAEKDEPFAAQIQKDVEAHLRAAGVHVLTAVEKSQNGAAPQLRVNVTTLKAADIATPPLCAFVVGVQFFQQARLLSGASAAPILAMTWEGRTAVGIRAIEEMAAIRDVVRDRVDEFIADWRSAQGKS